MPPPRLQAGKERIQRMRCNDALSEGMAHQAIRPGHPHPAQDHNIIQQLPFCFPLSLYNPDNNVVVPIFLSNIPITPKSFGDGTKAPGMGGRSRR